VQTHKRLMPAKINATRHISLHTWSRSHKVLPKPWWMGTTLATGHQDDNKNTYEANILCSLTFKVFQKHTFFRIKLLRPPSPKRPVAETASANCPRPKLHASLQLSKWPRWERKPAVYFYRMLSRRVHTVARQIKRQIHHFY